MPTSVLNAYSSAYPLITNRIRASIYLQSAPQAFIASIIDSTTGHPIRTWSFPGLPRNNYGFVLDEIDGSDAVVANLAKFDVVPAEMEGALNRDDEQIKAGVTPGFNVGDNTFTFDGSSLGSGTLTNPFQGNLDAAHAAFTLRGTPVNGDIVNIDFSTNPNGTDPPNSYSVISTVMTGWTLADLIADLYVQMFGFDVNTIPYNDGTDDGLEVHGFSLASISVEIISITGSIKPDYRGWEIVPSELNGRGILIRNDIDYTWNKVTGKFLLLQSGDVFASGSYYNIHFNPISEIIGNSYPTLSDFEIFLITVSTVLTANYFGKKLIVEPASNFIDVTLPDIATVVEGRPLMIEIGGIGIYTVNILAVSNIVWLRGSVYMMAGETLRIYKYTRAGVPEWRVDNADGNFKTVGQLVSDDEIQADVINKQLLDGSIKDKRQYARIYNEHILNLPIGQVVSFAAWSTGNNNRYYSLDNGSNMFHFPDRRSLYERNLLTGKAGDFLASMVGPHSHPFPMGDGVNPGSNIPDMNPLDGNNRQVTGVTDENTGTETRPDSYLINKYVLI